MSLDTIEQDNASEAKQTVYYIEMGSPSSASAGDWSVQRGKIAVSARGRSGWTKIERSSKDTRESPIYMDKANLFSLEEVIGFIGVDGSVEEVDELLDSKLGNKLAINALSHALEQRAEENKGLMIQTGRISRLF